MSPELAFNEINTQSILKESLENLGVKPEFIARTGLIVYIERDRSKPSVLYRADMDALPIKEDTGWEYASKNSNMHACGHDVHMSVLYGVIKEIIEKNVPGNYVFVFQPAEETIGGAKFLIDEMRERFKVKYATALHVTDEYKLGEFASTDGTLFACAMEITAKFKGLSAHIAQKQMGIDALKNAVFFLNEIYNSSIDNEKYGERILVGFGKARAGTVRNAVADYAEIQGSIRGETLEVVLKTFDKVLETAKKFGGELERGSLYPPVLNDARLAKEFNNFTICQGMNYIDCGMKYTGEDFGFFSMKYPSLMFWAGVRVGDLQYGLHNPKFLPPDDAIPVLVNFMVKWLEKLYMLS